MHGSSNSIELLMNELTEKDFSALSCQVVVCPPSLYVERVMQLTNGSIAVGAQNVSEYQQGAYTGEVAADMLKSAGCKFVIVGHSERRQIFGETSEQVARKVKAALEQGLTPLLCVGETLEQRDEGKTVAVVNEQVNAVIETCGIEAFEQIVIAYEPVWAIGTGKTASPQQAQEVHAAIRANLADNNEVVAQQVSILYGGSVKADNAAELFSEADIDGGLIGGASLKADDFYQICRSAG